MAALLAAAVGAAAALALQRLLSRLRPSADGDAATPLPLRAPAPHPGWAPPGAQPPPFAHAGAGSYRSVDTAASPAAVLYPLVISAVAPRPIALVSTLGAAEGGAGSGGASGGGGGGGAGGAPPPPRPPPGNLAPYSYFNVVAHDPPHVAIGMCATPSKPPAFRKDSLRNILETRQFVVNVVSEWYAEAANHCCGAFEYGEDEMRLAGLTPLASARVAPPRVAEAAVQLECELAHTYEVRNAAGDVSTTVVIGRVLVIHVADGVAGASPSGKLVVDPARLRPVSRLGGNTYGRTRGLFDLPRPDREARGVKL